MKESGKVSARARYAARRRGNLVKQLAKPAAVTSGGIDPVVVAELNTRLESSAQESGQLREAVARQRAEFDNFRRRTLKEKEQIRDAAREDVFAKLLPVLDNFERALQSVDGAAETKSIREGIVMVSSQLARLLEAEGLQRIESMNAVFDPNEHEAIATEERTDVEEHHICEEMLPGYRFKDKVLRPAMVKVAKAPAEKAEA